MGNGQTQGLSARCAVVGGGPAGMMLGLLLARAGIEVVVLEKHADFLRDFRGDTIHPSTLELMHELGLLDAFLELPHQKITELKAWFGGTELTLADFTHLPTHCRFIALMPQWDFLDFLAREAARYPAFCLRMQAEVTGLIEEARRIVGVRGHTSEGALEIRADLVVDADGRHSTVRQAAGLAVEQLGAPLDVLWFRLPRFSGDPDETAIRFGSGQLLVLLNRGEYWQCGYGIAKGSLEEIRAKGLPELRRHTRDDLLERAKAAPETKAPQYVAVRASDVVAVPLDWLWKGHLLRGSLEMMTGLPDIGKSQVHCHHAACVTTGREWPDGTNGVPRGNVIMLTAEDNAAQILKPRLLAAGADCERVVFLQRIRKDKKNRMFLLGEDLEELEQLIADTGDVRLVTIDPITAYMGGGKSFDSHRATDVRNQLGPLSEMAERTNVAFSAITHPAKNAGPRAIDHFLGSQAYIAAARLGHLCVAETDDDGNGQRRPTGRSLFASAKHNVTEQRIPAIAYQFEVIDVGDQIKAPRIVWGQPVDITADEALAATSTARGQQSNVATFLLDILANGPVPKTIIEERATVRGFSKDQLDRAKKKMGVVSFKEKVLQGRSFWALPQHVAREGE